MKSQKSRPVHGNHRFRQAANFLEDPVGMFRDALEGVFGRLDWLPIADGGIHRFRVPGDKSGTCNGWYVLYLDGIASGAFGSWRAGSSHTWSSRKPVDPLESQLVAQRIEQARQQRKVAEARRQNAVALRAVTVWSHANPAKVDHPYLTRKRIVPYSLRQSGVRLLVPLYFGNFLMNLQQIYPDGTKRFLTGGRIKGCYSPIGELGLAGPIFICEGWATGVSIHADTGHPVVCAMSKSNLLAVGRQLQRQYPCHPLIIAGDDDRQNEAAGNGNPGAEAARDTATKLGCGMVLPLFPPGAPLGLSDFNDLANWRATQ